MTDDLINREMGRDGGFAAIPSHLSAHRKPPVIARRYDEAIFATLNYFYYLFQFPVHKINKVIRLC